MKKAFTLVELAIVLVIIGLIMGMAIKGKSMIDAAKARADMAKIKNIETAYYVYKTKTGNDLPWATAGNPANGYDLLALSRSGIVSTKEFKFNFLNDVAKFSNGYNISIFSCAYTSGVFGATSISNRPDSMCLRFLVSSGDYRLFCHMEVMLDDKDACTGTAMYEGASKTGCTPLDYEPAAYNTCDTARSSGNLYLYILE